MTGSRGSLDIVRLCMIGVKVWSFGFGFIFGLYSVIVGVINVVP
jgi:hypothetical protein